MVDLNPNASSLQAQLQAQLQAGKTGVKPRTAVADIRPQPKDTADARAKVRGDDNSGSRRLPVKQPGRLSELSSPRELDDAKARVTRVAGNNREAPIGRTSARQSELRNQPLGQIVDIRV